MVQRFRLLLGILVALVFMGFAAAPASAQADAGRGSGGEYPQKAVARVTSIPCVSLETTRKHVLAVNTAVKANAEVVAFLPRMNTAITRLPASIAAAPTPMRAVLNALLTQFMLQRDQLVADGKSPALYGSITATTDSLLSLFVHIPCTG